MTDRERLLRLTTLINLYFGNDDFDISAIDLQTKMLNEVEAFEDSLIEEANQLGEQK